MEKFSYEASIAEINAILGKFKNQTMTIDELSSQVAKATELITKCREKLQGVDDELKKIIE
ncbi:MAG: exodeoxyribonuclease VII small subunit [Rikenellaceae bacterium]